MRSYIDTHLIQTKSSFTYYLHTLAYQLHRKVMLVSSPQDCLTMSSLLQNENLMSNNNNSNKNKNKKLLLPDFLVSSYNKFVNKSDQVNRLWKGLTKTLKNLALSRTRQKSGPIQNTPKSSPIQNMPKIWPSPEHAKTLVLSRTCQKAHDLEHPIR